MEVAARVRWFVGIEQVSEFVLSGRSFGRDAILGGSRPFYGRAVPVFGNLVRGVGAYVGGFGLVGLVVSRIDS